MRAPAAASAGLLLGLIGLAVAGCADPYGGYGDGIGGGYYEGGAFYGDWGPGYYVGPYGYGRFDHGFRDRDEEHGRPSIPWRGHEGFHEGGFHGGGFHGGGGHR